MPYIILPNLQTGEPVMGVADNKWKRANCPVDVGKPCPFLIAEGVADSTDDTIEVDQ
ncbi:phiRv1 phage protein [Mycobacterium tuberculosis]|nr:phiRv1 phage protein [Mycobacterium tuberculosis]